jgi:transposase
MNTNWLSDARKLPDEAIDYIRRIAVHAVIDRDYKPEVVAEVLNISRSAIYKWLSWYRDAGDEGLDTHKAPGATPVITRKIELWLKHTILHATPSDYGYDTELWTLKILADLLKTTFDVDVYPSTIANHLHRLNLSCQVPQYRAHKYDAAEVEHFISEKWPRIHNVAEKLGADIAFEDEAGIGIMTRSGRTWGEVNSPPTISASDQRGGYNVFSAITRKGDLYYRIEEQSVGSEEYIALFVGRCVFIYYFNVNVLKLGKCFMNRTMFTYTPNSILAVLNLRMRQVYLYA